MQSTFFKFIFAYFFPFFGVLCVVLGVFQAIVFNTYDIGSAFAVFGVIVFLGSRMIAKKISN